MSRYVLTLTLGLCCLVVSQPSLSADELFQTAVFTSGKEGYHTFRIPSLLTTQNGTLLAFCEGRKTGGSDHGDIDLLVKRSSDGGTTWGDIELVHEEGGAEKVTIGNSCPVIDQATGTIWLTFCRDNKKVLVTSSTDDGKTWSKPVDISRDVTRPEWTWVATGPGVGIQLTAGAHKGRLVIPCDHGIPIDGKRVMFSHVFYSDDAGKSWQLGGSLDRHTDECQVVELTDGRLMINMRSYWGRDGGRADRDKMRAVATSDDGGETWSELRFDKTLIEPICQASFLRYLTPKTKQPGPLLFSNPASRDSRRDMTVRASFDEGVSWSKSKQLYAGPAAYSCLTVLLDGRIGCLYETGTENAYQTLTFARFSLDELN